MLQYKLTENRNHRLAYSVFLLQRKACRLRLAVRRLKSRLKPIRSTEAPPGLGHTIPESPPHVHAQLPLSSCMSIYGQACKDTCHIHLIACGHYSCLFILCVLQEVDKQDEATEKGGSDSENVETSADSQKENGVLEEGEAAGSTVPVVASEWPE